MKIYITEIPKEELNIDEFLELLHPARKEKVLKRKTVKARNEAICSGLLIRKAFLEEGVSEKEFLNAQLVTGERGKPRLVFERFGKIDQLLTERGKSDLSLTEGEKPEAELTEIHYSLSHSGNLVMVAISKYPVGLDIQLMEDKDFSKLANRFFNKKELEYLNAETSDSVKTKFYKLWCAKEAYGKRSGEGLSFDKDEKLDLLNSNSNELLFMDKKEPGYMICICCDPKENTQGDGGFVRVLSESFDILLS